MKPRLLSIARLSFPLATAIAALLAAPAVSAANRYWDGGTIDIAANGNTASAGGAGTWNTTLLNWDAGASPHVAWNNAGNDTAIFAGTGAAIALTAPITVGGLTFSSTGYTFTSAVPATNFISVASGGVITSVANTTNALANVALAAGNTTWRFQNSNTTVGFGNATLLTLSKALANGTSVVISGTNAAPVVLTGTLGTITATVDAGNALGFSSTSVTNLAAGSVAVGANSTILRSGGNLNNAFLGILAPTSNTFAIVANNAGSSAALDLTNFPNASLATWDNVGTGSFAFTGTITPGSNGYRFGSSRAGNNINLPNPNSLTGANSVTVLGATLVVSNSNDYSGVTTISAGTLSLTGSLTGGTAIATSGTGILSESTAGVISGSTTITQGSSGTSVLSGTNTHTGVTTISTGTLSIATFNNGGVAGSLGMSSADSANIVMTGGSLLYSGGSTTTDRGLTLNGNGIINVSTAATNLTMAGVIAGGTFDFTKGGTGTLTLAGPNTWTGRTFVSGGTLVVNSINSGGGAAGPLGMPAPGGGMISIGTGTTTTTLSYIGTGDVTDRVINLPGTTGGAIIDQSGASGLLKFTSALTATGAGSKTLTLRGSTVGTGEIGGAIVDNSATNKTSLTKAGSGTWTLSGANTYTGATTVSGGMLVISGSPTGNSAVSVNSGGTMQLDYTTSASKIHDSAILTLGGGTLDLKGGTDTEIVASTTLTAGTASSVTSSSPGSVLQMGTITRNAGASINFSAPGIATTNTPNVSGILGTWATIGGTDWATNSTNGANGSIIAYVYSVPEEVPRLTPGTIADGATANVRIIEGSGAAGSILLGAATTTINSLNQSNSGGSSAATINPAGQTLLSNSILVGGGAGSLTIGTGTNNGFLGTATAGGDLMLVNNTANDFTINSAIADNTTASTLTKLGTGTATLTAANTYTGATTIGAGTLLLGGAGSLGAGGTYAAAITNSGTFNFGSSASQTLSGLISGSGSLTVSGSGTLTLSATNTFTGAVAANAGILALSPAGALTMANAFTGTGTVNVNPAALAGANLSLSGNLTGFAGTVNVATSGGTNSKLATTGTASIFGAGTIVNIASGGTWFSPVSQDGITVNISSMGNSENLGALRMDTVTLGSASSVVLKADGSIGGNTATNTCTINAVISDDGGGFSLTKQGAASMILGGANTYTGLTTVSTGALILKNASALGTTATGTTVASGARVELDALTITGESITINGSGTNFWGALQGRSGTSVWAGNVMIGAAADTRIGAAAGATLEVSGVIDDDVNDYRIMFRPADGTATVIVSGANTYTGGTSIVGGPVVASSLNNVVGGAPTSNFGAPVTETNGMLIIGTTTVGGILRYSGAGETTDRTIQIGANATTPVVGDTGGATIEANGATALSFSAPIFNTPTNAATGTSPTRTLTLQGTNTNANTISGIIQNNQIAGASTAAVALTKAGIGSWTLTGANTYTGTTTIKDGSLLLDTGANRLPSTGAVVMGDTATTGKLILGGTTVADQTLASLTATGLGGAVVGGNASNSTLTLTIAAASTFSGTLGGAGPNENNLALIKTGTNTLTLAGNNTYTGGTTINAGIVSVTNATALSSGTVTISGGVRLLVATGLEVVNTITLGTNAGVAGNGLVQAGTTAGTATVSGPITITNGATAGGHFAAPTAATVLHVKGVITSSVAVTHRAGKVMFSGGGTGYTALTNGQDTAMVGANDGIATTAAITIGASAAGMLDLNGFNQSLVGITKGGFAASIGNSSVTTDSVLTTTGISSYAGTIVDVISPGTMKVGLTVASGALTLTGVNTYTGATTINAGTLLVNSPGSLAGGSAVAVNGTGTLGGNGIIGGNVTVAAAGKLAPGASAGTLTIGGALDISAEAAGVGTLAYELGTLAGPNDMIVAGTLAIGNGALGFNDFVFTNLGGLEVGTYKLITSGGLTGTLDAGNLAGVMATGLVGTLRITGNDLELVVTTAYTAWANGSFTNPFTDKDPGQNPDGDTLTNLQEFAFGTDPTVAYSGPIIYVPGGDVTTPGSPVAVNFAVGGGVDFRAVFGRRKDYVAAGLTYTVQFSAGLDLWVNSTDTPTLLTGATSTGEVDAVSVPYPLFITTPRGAEKPTFFRIFVSSN